MGTYWGLQSGQWQGFGSRHPGVVQFCFCDGSVRPLRVSLDYNVYLSYSGIADGTCYGFDQ